MRIILDTNALRAESNLNGVSFRLLREYCTSSGSAIIVPAVVVAEVEQQIREKMADLRKAAAAARPWAGLGGLSIPTVDIPEVEPEDVRNRLVAAGLRVVDHPDVTHETLVTADLGRRAPFGEKSQGYRDALIWCTVMASAAEEPDTVLISADHHFPRDDRGNPGPGLRAWLGQRGANATKILIYEDLRRFADNVVRKAYPLVDQQILIREGKHEAFGPALAKALAENQDSMQEEVNRQLEGLGREGFEDPSTTSTLEPARTHIDDVRQMEDGCLLVDVVAEDCHVLLDFYVFRSDYWGGFGFGSGGYEHNEWYFAREEDVALDLSISAIYNAQKAEVETLEVQDVSIRDEWFDEN